MHVCRYAQRTGNERIREMRLGSKWVLRERFVVVVVVVPVFVFVSETRVSLRPRGMLSGCIAQRFSLPFVHGRLADRGPGTLEKHDLIYYEPHSRRRAMSCAIALPALFERKVCPDKCTGHSAMRRSCLDTLHDVCIFRVSFKAFC